MPTKERGSPWGNRWQRGTLIFLVLPLFKLRIPQQGQERLEMGCATPEAVARNGTRLSKNLIS